MLMAKANTNAIIIFDAPIFDELLHKSFWQHFLTFLIPRTVTVEGEHDEEHPPEYK